MTYLYSTWILLIIGLIWDNYWPYEPIFRVGLKSIVICFSYCVETKLLTDRQTDTGPSRLQGIELKTCNLRICCCSNPMHPCASAPAVAQTGMLPPQPHLQARSHGGGGLSPPGKIWAPPRRPVPFAVTIGVEVYPPLEFCQPPLLTIPGYGAAHLLWNFPCVVWPSLGEGAKMILLGFTVYLL